MFCKVWRWRDKFRTFDWIGFKTIFYTSLRGEEKFPSYDNKNLKSGVDSLPKPPKNSVIFKDLKDDTACKILTDFWQDASHTENLDSLILTPLTLGRSGAGLYKFTVHNQDYVLRIFSPVDSRSDHRREGHVSFIAGEHGIAPKVFFVDPNFEGVVMEFLPWRTILPSDVQTFEGIAAFTKFLRRVHAISIEGYPAKSHFVRVEEWLGTARARGGVTPPIFDTVYQKMTEIQYVLDHLSIVPVLIHNDLIPLNIMTDGKSFKLVDWPAAGMGDAFWDLIDFTTFLNFNDEQSLAFIEAYLEREILPQEWNRFIMMRPVPSIARVAGGFAFTPEIYSAQFYEEKCKDPHLTSFAKLMHDFSLGQLTIPLWEITCLMLKDAHRQISDPKFAKAIKNIVNKRD